MISVVCKEDRTWDPEHKGPADSGVVKVEVQGINVAVKVQPPGDWAPLISLLINPDSAEEIAGALVTIAGIVRRQAAAAKAEKKL
jgi:hypothetical protein